jgi:galactokinase
VTRVAFAPGRVNLIGDHTDYTGGLVLPMAIDLGTTVTFSPDGTDVITLTSDVESTAAVVPIDVADPTTVPGWGRYVAGVVCEIGGVATGGQGTVTTTLPVGAGLSSSAALEVACALAFGFSGGSALALAQLCQRAEQRASGVPCGIMDQLASAAGVEGSAVLIDCTSLAVTPVDVPAGTSVVAVHSGQARTLAGSAYADRRAACERAVELIGPLREASSSDVASLPTDLVPFARHVVTENARVVAFADALRSGDVAHAGALMVESHASLRDDFAVSTPVLDALVDRLVATPGVHGARLTGGGFGGAVVALVESGVDVGGWVLRPSAAASVSGTA